MLYQHSGVFTSTLKLFRLRSIDNAKELNIAQYKLGILTEELNKLLPDDIKEKLKDLGNTAWDLIPDTLKNKIREIVENSK